MAIRRLAGNGRARRRWRRTAPARRRQSGYARGPAERGGEDGFRLGWSHGHWHGLCEAVLRKAERPFAIRDIHVLYVATGKGFPYSPLDAAISDTFRGMVSQLTITDSTQPVASIAKGVRPDIVVVLDGLQMDVGQIDEIREAGIRTAIWFTDDPYYTDITKSLATHYDDVFTLELTCVDLYRQMGCGRVHYLPLAASPADFRPRNPGRNNRHDICFVGSAYLNRIAFFDQIAGYLAGKNTHISGIWWERLANFKQLAGKIDLDRWMGPAETADVYNGSKIVINMHRSHDDQTFNNNSAAITAVSPNPRTFEISACAALQLTDVRADLPSFYTPGVDIVTYSSPGDMVEKIEYYLHHEEERKAIALRGLYRTMTQHTYAHRLEKMLSILLDG